MDNLEIIFSDKKKNIDDLIDHYHAEFLPFQLIRGASLHNAFVIVDEAQTIDFHEMLTLGTRIGEGSKLVILGDLKQRDIKIAKDKTGIYKFCNDIKAKESPLAAVVELIKSERSAVSTLFADIFEE
jgi:PhoH-like ATPase